MPRRRARRTGPLRLLVWWVKGGSRRLKGARLRRQGKFLDTITLLAGALLIVEIIQKVPQDLDKRNEVYRQVARWLTRPV